MNIIIHSYTAKEFYILDSGRCTSDEAISKEKKN